MVLPSYGWSSSMPYCIFVYVFILDRFRNYFCFACFVLLLFWIDLFVNRFAHNIHSSRAHSKVTKLSRANLATIPTKERKEEEDLYRKSHSLTIKLWTIILFCAQAHKLHQMRQFIVFRTRRVYIWVFTSSSLQSVSVFRFVRFIFVVVGMLTK